MRDVQSTFRGYAPDARGGLHPPELVYETDEHAARKPWRRLRAAAFVVLFVALYAVAALDLFGIVEIQSLLP